MKSTAIPVVSVALVAASAFILIGCNDEQVPNQRLLDSMNKQMSAQHHNGPATTNPQRPDAGAITGNHAAPNGGARN